MPDGGMQIVELFLQFNIQAQSFQFFDKYIEGLWQSCFQEVVAFDNFLIHGGSPLDII